MDRLKCNLPRCLLLFFNTIFLILGIFTLSLSSTLLTKNNRIDRRLTSHCVFTIITGGILLLTAFYGYITILKNQIWMLRLYVFFVSIISIIHIMLAIMTFTTAYSMSHQKTKADIAHIFDTYEKSPDRKEHVDMIQEELKCCGLENMKSWGSNIPQSCCSKKSCTRENAYKTGCTKKLVEGYRSSKIVLAIVAAATATLASVLAVSTYFVTNEAIRRREAAFLNTAIV